MTDSDFGYTYVKTLISQILEKGCTDEIQTKINNLKENLVNVGGIHEENKEDIENKLNALKNDGKITGVQYNLLIEACGIQPASQSQYRQYNYQKS